MRKEFDAWSKCKKIIHKTPDNKIVYFRKKEIWWCSLGVNIGHEQDGKNKQFERPILIIKKINRYLIIGIPLSTKIKDHKYYCKYNFNDRKYSAILLQVRVLSSKRLLRRVGTLHQKEFKKVIDSVNWFIKE